MDQHKQEVQDESSQLIDSNTYRGLK